MQWTPVSWQSWENYNVTSGPYAVAGHGPAATTTHLTTAPCDGGDGGIAPCDGGDGGIVQKTTTTTHLSTSPCDGGDGGIVQHTTKLDGGGEYWDASIMERPDNTAGGDLWNPPDDESCCGISYHAVAAKTGLLQTAQHTSKLDGGGEYWDANILERPDNTASGTLWNPPDDESCCGISYHAVAAKTGMLSSCDGGDGGVISGCDGGDGGVVSGCACPACAGAPVQAALATIHEVPTQTRNDKEVRASPAHLILALHSCTAAAVEATGATIGRMIKGEAGESWENEFKERSKANSAAISPVSGFILDRHVMN